MFVGTTLGIHWEWSNLRLRMHLSIRAASQRHVTFWPWRHDMSDRYREVGYAEGAASMLVPGPVDVIVEDMETGEERIVCVGSSQTVGEAIANGQWKDD